MSWATEIAADSPLEWWKFETNGASSVGGETLSPTEEGDKASVRTPDFGYDPLLAETSNAVFLEREDIAINGAGYYNGTSNWIDTASAFTFEGVFRVLNAYSTNEHYLFCRRYKGTGLDRGFGLILDDGNLEFFAYDDSNTRHSVSTSAELLMGSYQDWHWAIEWTGTEIRLYVQGVLVDSAACTSILRDYDLGGTQFALRGYHVNGTWSYSAGYVYQDTLFCDLVVDEIVGFDSAIGATRIAAHHAAAGLAPPPGPVSARAYLKADTRFFPRVRAYLKATTRAAVSARAYLEANTAQVQARTYLKANTAGAVSVRAYLKAGTADLSVAQRAALRFRVRLLIDGVDKTALLTGPFLTEWAKEQNRIANFDLVPPAGTLDPTDYDGQPVQLVYEDLDAAGAVQFSRVRYQGTIVQVTWQPGQPLGLLRCRASTRSDARFRAMDPALLAGEVGGQWSRYVFNASGNGWDQLRDRMETLQADLWLLPGGGVLLHPWSATGYDVQWTGAEVLPESLQAKPPLRSQILNTIHVRMNYRFQRLRQRMLRCHWSTGVTWCERLLHPFPLCQRSMLESASQGNGGWQRIGTVAYEPIPGPQGYYCFPYAANPTQKLILWGGDANLEWAWQAWWTVGRRWLQDITELYSFQVVAPQSVAANGPIETVDEYGVESQADHTEWVSELGYSSAGDAAFSDLGGGTAATEGDVIFGDSTLDGDTEGEGNRADFEAAQSTAQAAAAAEVLGGHREIVTAVNLFDPRIRPGIRLRVVTDKIQATGNVVAIRERFEVGEGSAKALTEVDIAPFVAPATGAPDATPIEAADAPERPEPGEIPDRIYFPTRIGGLTNSPHYQSGWTGYTTNYEFDATAQEPFAAVPEDIGDRHYPDQFAAEYPEIPESDLQAIDVQTARRVEVAIPDDELVRIQ